MSKLRFHVKKGDEVKVISGNHQGASGKVLAGFAEETAGVNRGSAPDQKDAAQIAG